MNTKILTLSILFFVVGGAFGLAGGYLLNNGDTCITSKQDPSDTYQAGWEGAKQRLIETGYYFQMNTSDVPVVTLVGNIISAGESEIVIKINPLAPLADRALDERIVKISSNTKISKEQKKEETVYQKELKEFWADYPDLLNRPNIEIPLPSPYYIKDAVMADFKEGQNIVVNAKNDIRYSKSFIADEIIIQQ